MFHQTPASFDPSTQDLQAQVRRQLRGLMAQTLVYFADHEADTLHQVRAHLLELIDHRNASIQTQNLRSAYVLLDKQVSVFRPAYHKALQITLEDEAAQAFAHVDGHTPKKLDPSGDPLDGLSLTLIDMSEVDRILLVDRVAQRFTGHFEPSLTPLTARLSALLGLAAPSLAKNPFRPETFVRAFLCAWENSQLDPQASNDLLESLNPASAIDLTPLYQALDRMLAVAGVPAQPALRIRRASDQAGTSQTTTGAPPHKQPPAAARPSHSAWAGLVPVGRNIAAHARQFLQQLGMVAGPTTPGGAHASGAPGGEAAPTPVVAQTGDTRARRSAPDAEFLGYLGDLQAGAGASPTYQVVEGMDPADHNILRQMRDLDQVRRAPELDRGTVDALAEVFDYVFADQAIPVQMKFVIGRLQIPVLKAAMIDRDFFLCADHPARRLVDTLAHASIAWAPEKGELDPLYVRIENTVKRLLTEFEDDLDLFRDLLREFTEFLFETEQQAQGQIEPATQRERRSEVYEEALAHADAALHTRINMLPTANFMVPFLAHPWRDVLAQAWLAADTQPAAWDAAVTTMDQLIWSTQPKIRAEERRQLVAVLPQLVRNLNQGLDAIAWNSEPRATFTRRLITTHALAIRITQPPMADTATVALEARAGQAAMDELDARLAKQLSGDHDEFDDLAKSFTRGMWFDFAMEGGTRHRCRLSWVSPMRTRLLFTNREGFDAFVRTEREVAALLRHRRLSLIEQAPIVARALGHILDQDDLKLAA